MQNTFLKISLLVGYIVLIFNYKDVRATLLLYSSE